MQVGTHYIGTYLTKIGFEVAHLSAPITPLHRLKSASDDLCTRRLNNSTGGVHADKMLWHYVPRALLAPDNRPLLSSAWVLKHWQSLTYPSVVNVVKNAGFVDVDFLMLDSIYQSFWLDELNYQLSAYRLADNASGFSGYSNAMAETEGHIIKTVDKVFTASHSLQSYAEGGGAKSVTHLPNGIDLARFNDHRQSSEIDFPNLSGPVAVYVGAFENWFDHPSIHALASARSDVNILLIGPKGPWSAQYKNFPNVHMLGSVPTEQVPDYLEFADVGLIPFNVEQYPTLINDVNPLKLYEYLAAGLPVVSYRWKEIERLNSPAELVANKNEFVAAVTEVLSRPKQEAHNKQFASTFDWNTTLAPLGEWLQENIQGVICA